MYAIDYSFGEYRDEQKSERKIDWEGEADIVGRSQDSYERFPCPPEKNDRVKRE